MPDGSTGAMTPLGTGCVETPTGTGTGPGIGGGGNAGLDACGEIVDGSFSVGVGVNSSFRGRGISRAVSDAPANADVAAMMAIVVLDICGGW